MINILQRLKETWNEVLLYNYHNGTSSVDREETARRRGSGWMDTGARRKVIDLCIYACSTIVF